MSNEVILDGMNGVMVVMNEWGHLEGNYYGMSSEDDTVREIFNNLEDF